MIVLTNYSLGKRCLFVEDQRSNQRIVGEILEREGFSLYFANNGKEGLELIFEKENNFFDFIITDLRMPVMNGENMILEIRRKEKLEKIRKTPIIVLTGSLHH